MDLGNQQLGMYTSRYSTVHDGRDGTAGRDGMECVETSSTVLGHVASTVFRFDIQFEVEDSGSWVTYTSRNPLCGGPLWALGEYLTISEGDYLENGRDLYTFACFFGFRWCRFVFVHMVILTFFSQEEEIDTQLYIQDFTICRNI